MKIQKLLTFGFDISEFRMRLNYMYIIIASGIIKWEFWFLIWIKTSNRFFILPFETNGMQLKVTNQRVKFYIWICILIWLTIDNMYLSIIASTIDYKELGYEETMKFLVHFVSRFGACLFIWAFTLKLKLCVYVWNQGLKLHNMWKGNKN